MKSGRVVEITLVRYLFELKVTMRYILLIECYFIFVLIEICFCNTKFHHNTSVESWEGERTTSSNSVGVSELCSCQPETVCATGEGPLSIDIRIVTTNSLLEWGVTMILCYQPPEGVECGPGMAYCCFIAPQQQCGVRNNSLTSPTIPHNGQSKFGEYPWQAIIMNLENDYIASGVIVDAHHVVTVAHKVAFMEKNDLIVRVGDWDVQSEREPYTHLDVRVIALVIHPQFQPRSLAFDIAVLTLSQGLRLYPAVPHVNSICLPSPSTSFDGIKCWVSGWGKDMFGSMGSYQNIQKEVDVTIVSGKDCEQQLQETRLGRNFRLDQQSFLCGGGELDKDACTGDGGSPLVCEGQDGRWTLAGLVAWGVGCAQSNVPGVYVNIATMVSWLQQQCSSPANKRL